LAHRNLLKLCLYQLSETNIKSQLYRSQQQAHLYLPVEFLILFKQQRVTLVNVLEGIDAHIPYRSVIDESATGEQITQELYKLMTMQTRVFVVHMSSSLGSLFFESFAGPIVATGVASTTSLVIALITYFCKIKQVGPESGDSEQILPPETGGDEERQCQQIARARGIHGQIKNVMRDGSLVMCRGERIHNLWVSSSARF